MDKERPNVGQVKEQEWKSQNGLSDMSRLHGDFDGWCQMVKTIHYTSPHSKYKHKPQANHPFQGNQLNENDIQMKTNKCWSDSSDTARLARSVCNNVRTKRPMRPPAPYYYYYSNGPQIKPSNYYIKSKM